MRNIETFELTHSDIELEVFEIRCDDSIWELELELRKGEPCAELMTTDQFGETIVWDSKSFPGAGFDVIEQWAREKIESANL